MKQYYRWDPRPSDLVKAALRIGSKVKRSSLKSIAFMKFIALVSISSKI